MACIRLFLCLFLSVILLYPVSAQITDQYGPDIKVLEQSNDLVVAILTTQLQHDVANNTRSLEIDNNDSEMGLEQARLKGAGDLILDYAIKRAVHTHPSLRQAVGALLRSDENIEVAKAGYFPQIRGGINTEHNNRNFDNYDTRTLHRMTVSATQMLYDFGEVSSRVDKAESERMAARARVLLSIDQVSRETAYAFIELQRYQALQGIATDQVKGVAAIAELARERRLKGASALSDELQAQSREEAARATLLDISAQVQRWKHALAYLTGIERISAVVDTVPNALQIACAGDTPLWGLLPEVLVAEAERAVALAELDHASAQMLPTLSVETTLGRALNASSRSGNRNDASAMLNFSMPFYQGGSMRAQKRAAGHALSSADAARSHARLTASQNLMEARDRERGHRQRLSLLKERTASIDDTRALYREQYLELGTRSLLDLLNAEQEYHQSKIEKANNEYDMRRMQVDCLYNSGQLREAFGLNGTSVDDVEIAP